ncbi:MAG: glycosyltransferase family 2 protein [Deltaproteobacteria bacterium]|nr:MAG: glycosyltransferase family 2 protein [Deltaproteobacteria bacterium]
MNAMAGIGVLIPAYNASHSLRGVLEGIKGYGLDIVVVDDGSTDATAEVAEELGIHVLRHRINRGKGIALKTGFRFLLLLGYRAVITMDADGQHDPTYIPHFIRSYQEGKGEIIIGSRSEEFGKMNWLRRFWNKLGVKAVSKLTGTPLTDTQSGYRLIKGEVLRCLPLCASGYEAELELLIKACKRGHTVVNIPTTTHYADGRPSSHFRPVRDTWLICRTFLQEFFWR